MPDVTVERRSAPRQAMILAAEVVELPRGTTLSARTADISRTGCYVDTLNPIPQGSQVQLRLTRHEETFVTLARVVYVSPGLGMGLAFLRVEDQQLARLDRWLSETGNEFQG